MKKIILFTLMFHSASSLAATYTCEGKVQGLSINPQTGSVLAEKIGPLAWPVLCSVKKEENGVAVETCKMIYSTLLSAQMSDKSVMLWFNDSKDCTAASHTPWHDLTGWYFVPKIY